MGFSYEEIVSAVTDKLDKIPLANKLANGKSGVDTSSLVLNALLSKAPKPFLSSLDTTEFANVVRISSSSLESLTGSPDKIFIDSVRGIDCCYISVVLRDCPFIINTFDNVIERLGLSELVTLHPIVSFGHLNASVSVLVFSGIDLASQELLKSELVRALPLLTKLSTDFQSMSDVVLQLSSSLSLSGSSPWSLDLSDLLKWLTAGGFVFLGATRSSKEANSPKYVFNDRLGILAFDYPELQKLFEEIATDYSLFKDDDNLRVSKLTLLAPVHRRKRLLHIAVRDSVTGNIHSFVGSLSSRGIAEEVANVPVVRLKLDQIVQKSQVSPNGHDHKFLVRLINATPKNHLFISDFESLSAELKLVEEAEFLGHSLAILNLDSAKRGVSSVLAFSSSRFNAAIGKELQAHLEKRLDAEGNESDVYFTSLNESIARIYFYTPLSDRSTSELPSEILLAEIGQELSEISSGWFGRLEVAVQAKFAGRTQSILTRYQGAFTRRYQALTAPLDALNDIEQCEKISVSSPIKVRYEPHARSSSLTTSTIDNFHGTVSIVSLGKPFTLGQTLPVLENLGLEVIDSETLELKLASTQKPDSQGDNNVLFLHRFFLNEGKFGILDVSHFEKVVAPALESVFTDVGENDSLNSLMLSANLNNIAVSALRTYYNLLWQIRKTASRLSIRASLTNNPNASVLLWKLFQIRFDPSLNRSITDRIQEFEALWKLFQEELKGVNDIIEDSALKALSQLIWHTVRTNFFQSPSHIAHKIHSEKLPLLRGAKPVFETFVYGPVVEGIHLRSSKVSRGGIRWSERREDYRTEVLGLMRVQRIKNAIAVPGGAKGGFIIRESGRGIPITREAVVAGYKEYIRALLSLADNIVDGNIVSPNGLIIYDESDPYLVVAADKGTASFSDYANQIAIEEFNFWLNDGFASGGSKGYGHKELGITARGAWECTKHHFIELGINYEESPFSVVGIGDMSGDVFGNGLLLSKNMKLIAAFDHRHVFIDPNPNLEVAFAERQRLFGLTRSSWADYDLSLISEGGGICNRLDKDIHLSVAARRALSVPDEEMGPFNGEQVISLALKAEVDLLWNGGIGTYVKASTEVDSEVNDSANDAVRINGADLRAKVVAEGGNVGFTQAARVEFSLNSGRINTDSIDNSAGVDLSDHEVNLKILFQKLQSLGLCSREERDLHFKQMSDEVVAAVLSHNSNQAFIISVAERASKKSLDYFRALIRELCDRSYLTRAIDGLPSDDELEKRSVRRTGLTRPEIAVCLAGVKLWIKDEILRSGIAKDPALEQFSIHYFPKVLQEKYKAQLLTHQLLENITAAELTNHLVDIVGITFVHRLQLTEGVEMFDALRATIAASIVVGAKDFLQKIESLHSFVSRNDFFDARLDLGRAVRVIATQFVHRFGSDLSIIDCQNRYQAVIAELFRNADRALPVGTIQHSFNTSCRQREKAGLSPSLSRELSLLHISWLILDASDLAGVHKVSIIDVHTLLVYLWERLGLDFLVLNNQAFTAKNKWEHELMIGSYDRLRTSVAKIASVLITKGALKNGALLQPDEIGSLIQSSPSFDAVESTVAEFTTNTPEIAVLHALARHLENFRV